MIRPQHALRFTYTNLADRLLGNQLWESLVTVMHQHPDAVAVYEIVDPLVAHLEHTDDPPAT